VVLFQKTPAQVLALWTRMLRSNIGC
jgi:hypothetical protein